MPSASERVAAGWQVSRQFLWRYSTVYIAAFALTSPAAHAQDFITINRPPYSAVLGQGINTVTGEPRDRCMEPEPGTQINPSDSTATTVFRLEDSHDRASTRSMLSFDASGSVGIGPFAASAEYKRLADQAYLSFDTHIIGRILVTYNPMTAATYRLTRKGRDARRKGPAVFAATCGNAFIDQIITGGELYIDYALHDDESTSAATTAAQAKLSIGMWAKGEAEFTQAITSAIGSHKLTYEFYRNGAREVVPSADSLGQALREFPTHVPSWKNASVMQIVTRGYGSLAGGTDEAQERYHQATFLAQLARLADSARTARDNFSFVRANPTQFLYVNDEEMAVGEDNAAQFLIAIHTAAIACADAVAKCDASSFPCNVEQPCIVNTGYAALGKLPERVRAINHVREFCLWGYDVRTAAPNEGPKRVEQWVSIRNESGQLLVYSRPRNAPPGSETVLSPNEIPTTADHGFQKWAFQPRWDDAAHSVRFTKVGRYEGIHGESHWGQIYETNLDRFGMTSCNETGSWWTVTPDGAGGWEWLNVGNR